MPFWTLSFRKQAGRCRSRPGWVWPAEEFGEILNVYNKYPLCELTIHPRVMKQLYRGQADREAFAAYLPACTAPVCYNGDVTTVDDLRALEAAFPELSGIMVGRGLIADPAFCARLWAALPLPGKNCAATMMNSITLH